MVSSNAEENGEGKRETKNSAVGKAYPFTRPTLVRVQENDDPHPKNYVLLQFRGNFAEPNAPGDPISRISNFSLSPRRNRLKMNELGPIGQMDGTIIIHNFVMKTSCSLFLIRCTIYLTISLKCKRMDAQLRQYLIPSH